MNKWISLFIDHIGLCLLHRKRSLQTQYRSNIASTIDQQNREAFYQLAKIPDLSFQFESSTYPRSAKYQFNSPIQSGDESNDIARGICYLNEKEDAPIHVIVVHGWRADNLDKFTSIFLKKMNKKGYNVYFPTLPYHFDRSVNSLYSGEYMISANVSRTITAIRQAVVEIRGLIQWLKQNKRGKVVLVGISLGGYISNLVSLYEQKVDALVSVMYANNLAYEIWSTPIGKYIKQDFLTSHFTYDQLERCWSILRADQSEPMIRKENTLLISGKYDLYVTEQDTKNLWLAWGKPKRLLYNCGHAGIVFNRKQIAKDTINFIQNFVTNGKE